MKEEKYKAITYDTTMIFAKALHKVNPQMVFIYVSGRGTDSKENSKTMWARVKGKTENDLMKIGFKGQYNFRPALMLTFKGQKSAKSFYKFLAQALKFVMPKATLTLKQVGQAMINVTEKGYPSAVLEVEDIRNMADN